MPDPGTPEALRGRNGDRFLFEVTGTREGTVWGTDTYTDDSTIATAAVHAGILKVGQKAVVKVTILPGQPAYAGSVRNGVASEDWNNHEGSFKVEIARFEDRARKLPPGVRIDPGTLENVEGRIGQSFVFEVVGRTDGDIWGTGVYTDDSSLATVAVHAGILRVGEKGLIKVTILPGQKKYTGSMRNGVESEDYVDWDRSFRVEAVKK
jgi:hypothetical protein